MEQLEKMADFFASRVEMYDEHMLDDVEGCREGYKMMADFVPQGAKRILDLGCGTGLELEAVFEKNPDVEVTGIDLCREMLSKLEEKYKDKKLSLVCEDYFTGKFGGGFDCVLSFQTMHHFAKEKKLLLYKKISDALAETGVYIECDYMVEAQQEEDFYFAENARIRNELGIGADEFYHYDIPCTVENQIALLRKAGFTTVEKVMRIENTTMLVAGKR